MVYKGFIKAERKQDDINSIKRRKNLQNSYGMEENENDLFVNKMAANVSKLRFTYKI